MRLRSAAFLVGCVFVVRRIGLLLVLVSITQAGSKWRMTTTNKAVFLEHDERDKEDWVRRGRRERGIWRV